MFNLIPWHRKKARKEEGALATREEHPLVRLRNEIDALFDRFLSGWPALPDDATTLGWAWDVDDQEDRLVVRAEAPGFEPEDFDVRVSGNHLVIQAEHKQESKDKNGHSYRYGSFYRAIPLPPGIEADKVEARYRRGVLEVEVPKGPEAQRKRIPVKTG